MSSSVWAADLALFSLALAFIAALGPGPYAIFVLDLKWIKWEAVEKPTESR
jgi:hypothetical protein